MIEKFLSIKGVGKFLSCKAAGDVSLAPLTLVYAENGRGKTTICDILRSARNGNGDYIRGRGTLGLSDEPEVAIRRNGATLAFKSGTWSDAAPEIVLFDATFISENVYAGEFVEHEHKKNLYRIIVGEEGVALARQVDNLDDQIKQCDRAAKDAKGAVERMIPSSLAVDAVVALQSDPDIDAKIASKQAELSALGSAAEIAAKPLLDTISLPALPRGFASTLTKQLADVSADAETRVGDHLRNHTEGGRESWASQGLDITKDDECPFCQQDIAGNALTAAYRDYFGASYKSLKEEVASLSREIRQFGGDAHPLTLRRSVEDNAERIAFWTRFVELQAPELDLPVVLGAFKELVDAAAECVERKADAILEATSLGDRFERASAGFEGSRALVTQYNETVSIANARISAKKGETSAGDLARAESELARLQATKRRYEPDGVGACDAYAALISQKKDLEKQKTETKEKLDEHSQALLGKFQKRINELLEMVTAGFRIANVAREYRGRSPRSTYHVLINDVEVSLGDHETPVSQPSFRNTLSSGDRSTLALAFFIAQLELDPNLKRKCIVLDDPFTSQDHSRRTWTQQRICRLARSAEQLIVLSHEPYFLRLIYDNSAGLTAKTLQLCRIGPDNTTITPWNIRDETRGDYFKDYAVLRAFLDDGEGDLHFVARTIRLVLEGYLRFKFIGQFGDSEWLGDFIDKIRSAAPGDVLEPAQGILEALEDINDYSKKYHHQQNPDADTESIIDGELQQFVRRALNVVGGF